MALRLCGLADDPPVDRWQICHFTPPSHVMIGVCLALQGQGGDTTPEAVKASSWGADFITPQTEASIHCLRGKVRRFRPNDDSFTEQVRAGQGAVFAEDQPISARWRFVPAAR